MAFQKAKNFPNFEKTGANITYGKFFLKRAYNFRENPHKTEGSSETGVLPRRTPYTPLFRTLAGTYLPCKNEYGRFLRKPLVIPNFIIPPEYAGLILISDVTKGIFVQKVYFT